MIEVEVATPGENLPEAVISPLDDETPIEVDVVVDFGMAEDQNRAIADSNRIVTHNNERPLNTNAVATPDDIQEYEDEEKMSEVSANWAEDQNNACSPEELQVI